MKRKTLAVLATITFSAGSGVTVGGATASAADSPTTQRVTGIVQTMVVEHAPGQDAGGNDTFKVLRVGTTTVQLTEGSLSTIPDGTTVSVATVPAPDGTRQVVSVRTVSAATTSALVAAATPAPHQVYVALVLPAGVPAQASLTDAAARAAVTRTSAFWASQTGNQVSFNTAQVLPLYRSAYRCDMTTYQDDHNRWAEALKRMPKANGPGKHLVLIAPPGATAYGCNLGLGSGGTLPNEVFASGLDSTTLAHELGHNLGRQHSNSLRCGSTQDKPMINRGFPGCQRNEYDDPFDVMGYFGAADRDGNLNAVHLDGMRLLPNAVRRITGPLGVTTVRLTPLSDPLSAATTNRVLKITDPGGGGSYFVEYRTNSGRDALTGRSWVTPSWGVRVLRDNPEFAPSVGSYVLDATPGDPGAVDYNRVIPVGGSFTAASKKLSIKVIAQDDTGATVAVLAVAPVPTAVSLSIPTRAGVGAVINASIAVNDQYGWAIPHPTTVTLQKMQSGTRTWRSIANVGTAGTGLAYRFTNGVSGYYRWVSAAANGAPTLASPAVKVTSTARVVQKRPATRMARGASLKMYGWISPIRSAVVYIQVRSPGGAWHSVARATVKGRVVSGKIKLRKSAFTRFYLKSTTSYRGSFSGVYATLVR